MKVLKALFASKKFVTALATTVGCVVAQWGYDVEYWKALAAAAPLLVYIFGQGFADLGKEINKK
ncbi:MAG: hypothetical protein DRG33_06015 [Deltaproteobacteria bacterium]|nr:MAG: hypothetical protein DRG33_06015 [Deltaproteobacteria bacterium]